MSLLVIVLIMFLGFSFSYSLEQKNETYSDYEYNRMLNKAAERGSVPVIVKLDVARLEILTAASTSYSTGTSQAVLQEAINADLELEAAINDTCDTVLHRLNGSDYRVYRIFKTVPYMALSVTAESLQRLRTTPEVVKIYEDKPIRVPRETLNTTAENNIEYPMLNQSVGIVGADVAWGFGYTGQGWYVAVLDTGLRTSHEMFQGKSILEQCFARGEDYYDTQNGSCPNGKAEMSGPGSAAPWADRFGHGTHVAGIATGNNKNGRYGVAKNAGVIAIQVFSFFPDENDVLSWNADSGAGLEYIYTIRNQVNIASANMSLGGSEENSSFCDDFRSDIIKNLNAAGIAVAVASGNNGWCNAVTNPACVPEAVAVGGSNKNNEPYTWGNWHNEIVDILAPGTAINSADSMGDVNYISRSGTSMSTPHVAGAWAIMKQYDPSMGVNEVLELFRESGKMISNTGRCPSTTPLPQLNVGDALSALLYVSPPVNINAEQYENKSLLQTEYINEITWEVNPLNADKDVVAYKVYEVVNDNLVLLTQVDNNTFKYWHRSVNQREEKTYAISAVNSEGQESPARYYNLKFGVVIGE